MNEKENKMINLCEDIKSSIEILIEHLKANGWELDENGDIIDSKTKKLVLGGKKDE